LLEGEGVRSIFGTDSDAFQVLRWLWVLALLCLAVVTSGSSCGSSPDKSKVVEDAIYDPAVASDAFDGTSEASPAAAQTFTVLNDGRLEQFEIVLTQGSSADSGMVSVDIRPTDGLGAPDMDPSTALVSFDVDTSTLPPTLREEFTLFQFGGATDIDVLAGEEYAIVVEFVSRATSTDTAPIALLLGVAGDGYMDGDGYTGESNVGFMDSAKDYFFATYVRVSF